ncbi:Alpha/Beta hydrolase protein [Phyllosticta capitalensis]
MAVQPWSNLPEALGGPNIISQLDDAFKTDSPFLAFATTNALKEPQTFAIKSAGSDTALVVTVCSGKGQIKVGKDPEAAFTLVAPGEHWEAFFRQVPINPYQSFWGMLTRGLPGVKVEGSEENFDRLSHIWRRVLELIREAHSGHTPTDPDPSDTEEDFITGEYKYITAPLWGRNKIFIEKAGSGRQQILFLHTAGSDSRQYHGVMNDSRMRERCSMYAVDLPSHGRSFPIKAYPPGAHTNTENAYVGFIAATVKRLGLKKPIICGASMAGQVCLAIAMRHEEVGAAGTIPLQGCEYISATRNSNDRSPYVNQSLWNPEWVYGMASPTAPPSNKALLWHTYSGQAYGIFHGDLDFYFGGFDGRERIKTINTRKCPVYMLTGEYDWSTTPAMSEATAAKIPGVGFRIMEGLGHFPATENPQRFIPYLIEAIDWIQQKRKEATDLSLLRMTDD